jgi:hypothetical protein
MVRVRNLLFLMQKNTGDANSNEKTKRIFSTFKGTRSHPIKNMVKLIIPTPIPYDSASISSGYKSSSRNMTEIRIYPIVTGKMIAAKINLSNIKGSCSFSGYIQYYYI